MLLYGLEACPMNKSDLNSLDFTVDRFFMKLVKTVNIEIVGECQKCFGSELPSVILDKRCRKFVNKYDASENLLCKMYGNFV